MPSINAFASYGIEKSRFSEDLDDTLDGWRAGVTADWSIFSSFETASRVRQAESREAQSLIALRQARLDIETEVRRGYSRLLEARQLVKTSKKVVAQAKESLRLAKNRFTAGSGTQLEVLDAQVALTEARSNRVQALYDFSIAVAQMNRVVGLNPFDSSSS